VFNCFRHSVFRLTYLIRRRRIVVIIPPAFRASVSLMPMWSCY